MEYFGEILQTAFTKLQTLQYKLKVNETGIE